MKLAEWIKGEIDAGTYKNKTAAMRALAAKIKAAGGETVSFLTLQSVERGQTLSLHRKALAIEVGTDKKVTVAELCQ